MSTRFARHLIITALPIAALLAGCAPQHTGPWNLAELNKPPTVQWAETQQSGGKTVRTLYYANEPFDGHSTRVFAYYAYPTIHQGKLPAMVLVHGGGGKAFREWAELWADRGYAALCMDLAGKGPDDQRLSDGGPDQGDPDKFEAIDQGLTHAWPYHAIAAVIRAHSLLRAMPEVDANRTGVTGISWGGYLTCLVSGLDSRFKVAVPVYGCGYLYEDSYWLPTFARMSPASRQLWIDNYDPSRYLGQARMPMLFVNGTNDFAYPLVSYRRSYELVKGPRTLCVTVRMKHSHPDGWACKETGLFVDSVLKSGTPLPRFSPARNDGRQVSAHIDSLVPIKSAALAYTTDTGTWQKRQWQSVPATLDSSGKFVSAELPVPDGITWFLTATDDRGATVSTEHQCFAKKTVSTCPASE
jgi:dienelactone hydrolase